jgi:hypothetical protein
MGGAEHFLARLAGALATRGHPTIAVLRRGADLKGVLDPAVDVVETGMRNGADIGTWWAIRRLVRDRKPRIVQTYLGRSSRLTRVPRRSATVHVARLGGYYRPDAYRHADVWVGNTLGICDHLLRLGFPAERIHPSPTSWSTWRMPKTGGAGGRCGTERGSRRTPCWARALPGQEGVRGPPGRFRPSAGEQPGAPRASGRGRRRHSVETVVARYIELYGKATRR